MDDKCINYNKDNIFLPLTITLPKLFVGGSFDSAGGKAIHYLASWNGNTWDSAGTGVNGAVNTLTVFNSKLFVGGWFTTAGGHNANYIASYSESPSITGIENVAVNSTVNVFPNPSNGKFNVEMTTDQQTETKNHIEIYSMLGDKVYEASMDNGRNSVDLKGCNKGMYLYTVLASNGTVINQGKIMVQ